MRAGVRSCLTASVALVGAGAIAITPVNPLTTDVLPITQHAVSLAAVPNPIQLYSQVFQRSLDNAGALAQQYFADPFPITGAILQNQGVAVADALAALQAGDSEAFVAAATDVVLEPFRGTGAALSHLGALLNQPYAVEGFFLIAISPVLAGVAATQRAFEEVIDALVGFDLVGAAYAVLNIPGRVIDGVLNGVPGASFGILEDLPGLLSPLSETGLPPGPIAVGTSLDQDMGAAIPPREPATGVGDVPDLAAATITLDADEVPAEDSGRSDADDAPAEDTTETEGTDEESGDSADAESSEGGAEPAEGGAEGAEAESGQAAPARTSAKPDSTRSDRTRADAGTSDTE
ncbi:hypothetical protein [Mycolicibacterium gilvum]|uniref:hypothetical protein n=1 Tax=Mycolicibacterium gilvum TaxID=1804 RepID=UPI0040458ED8